MCILPVDFTYNNTEKDKMVCMKVCYFMLSTPSSSTATYIICKGNVVRSGHRAAKYNTTNLISVRQYDEAVWDSL